jgi:hypothetical protein
MVSKNNLETLHTIPKSLLEIKEYLNVGCGFDCTVPIAETESAAYAAYRFKLNGLAVVYREAKITPTKVGQFVTLWKRSILGITEPFEISDPIDFVVVATRDGDHFGKFVFPKSVLFSKGVFSGNNKEGKRGIRVYPPWDLTVSKQAQQTQQWQLRYFLEIPRTNEMDLNLVKRLYSNEF